jgi:hypothetical protein
MEENIMRLPRLFRSRKSRKYPIQRDQEGKSLRVRCFAHFDQGQRPAQVAKEFSIKEPTVCRYFRDWQRLGPNFEKQYAYVKGLFKKTAPDRDRNIELFAGKLGIPKEQFEAILSQPHGLRRFLTGKLYFPIQAQAAHKMSVSLQLGLLFSDHLIKNGGKFEDVCLALKRYMREHKQYREEEESDIKEENQTMKFIHEIMAVDLEKERQGRVKPDRLSEEERNTAIKWGIEAEARKAQMWYWFQIGTLKAHGLTVEQARDKMYQDLIDKGNLKAAKLMRELQDRIHPLKNRGQPPPSSPPPQHQRDKDSS